MTAQAEQLTAAILTVGDGDDSTRRSPFCTAPASDRSSWPTLVWLGGYRSDMTGTKAVELDALAANAGLGCHPLRLFRPRRSGGEFRDGTISRWLEEALAVLDHDQRRSGHPRRLVDGRLDRASAGRRNCASTWRRPRCAAWC